ncbi:Zinc finger BED domain-containing protein 5-like 18 [Homarus americanus]|uniref:Zinc finger BED domain-containing protein 5-like 18 n=1 Tax=Homarus americanus TaxID=6706 RepID=A0A8J5JYM6_HOMAM|nr:Zinc finger BED domain-containing protein 5-like 18 [Homarus americanus]
MKVEGHGWTAYLVDIFEALNALNLKLQGTNINIIMHHDTIRTFMAKLDLWKCRIQQGNTASFSNLDSALIHGNLDSELKKQIITHLTDLKTEFIRYFPEIDEKLETWKFIRNPFQCEVADVSDEVQEEFLELKFNSTAKEDFKELDLETFCFPVPNSQSPVPSPQSPVPDSQSPVPSPQFPVPDSQSPVPRPQFLFPPAQFLLFCYISSPSAPCLALTRKTHSIDSLCTFSRPYCRIWGDI